MASSDTASMGRKVENLRAFVAKLARSKRLLLPEPKLLEQRLLDLCSSRTPDHPPYSAMIHVAITELNEGGGSSEEAISEFIKSKYKGLPHAHTSLLSHHLAKLVEKEEILRDGNNHYMLPRENTAASVDEKTKKVKIKLRRSSCCNGTDDQHVAEIEDRLEVDQNLATEVITDKKEKENNKILDYEEHKVEKAGNLFKEHDLTTGAETHAEVEASGEFLKFEILEVRNRYQSLEEEKMTTEAQLLAEKDEISAVLQCGELENQDLQNCKSPEEEKEKQELGGGQYREKEMLMEEGKETLEDRETEERIEVSNKDDENQQKQDQEDEAREVNEVEDLDKQSDALMRKGLIAEEGKNGMHAAVDVVKEACREVIFERHKVQVQRWEYMRLREKQTEACSNIVALEKMLTRCTRGKEQNGAVSACSSSFGAQHDEARFGSLPLSKESCKQLWKFVHKIQGQLFEIIDSFDKTEVSDYESQGYGVESMRKGLFQEGPKKAKNPCNTGEVDSHTKPQVEDTSAKRSQDVEAVELGESFREQKRRKLCDGQAFPLLVPSDVTCDSTVSKEMEAGPQSAEAAADFCSRELMCVETTWLEKKCQREKLDLCAENQDAIGGMQTKARRHDQVALEIEASDRTIAEPSTSHGKSTVEDGQNRFEQRHAQLQPRERPPESIVNSDTSATATCFSDHPNNNEKQLQKLATGTSLDKEISESSLQLRGQVTSGADAESDTKEVSDNDLSQPSGS